MRFLWAHSLLRWLAVAAGLINLGSSAFFGVFVLWVVGVVVARHVTPNRLSAADDAALSSAV
jgi:hypothetical protein